jgi:hypothetical protein
VDDGRARFDESEGLGGLVARLGNDEHYPYEGKCQERAIGVISVHSQGRTRDGGAHRRVNRVWIRGFGGRDGGYDTEKLDIVVHDEGREVVVYTKEQVARERREESTGASSGLVESESPLSRLSESQFRVTASHALPLSPPMADSEARKPVCIIAIGMAGSGKSTFVQRLNTHLHALSPPAPPYVLNLDPAVTNISYEPNIDIRDTVDYHQVMRQCAVAVPLCPLR